VIISHFSFFKQKLTVPHGPGRGLAAPFQASPLPYNNNNSEIKQQRQ
jgi:hypothetical protein